MTRSHAGAAGIKVGRVKASYAIEVHGRYVKGAGLVRRIADAATFANASDARAVAGMFGKDAKVVRVG